MSFQPISLKSNVYKSVPEFQGFPSLLKGD